MNNPTNYNSFNIKNRELVKLGIIGSIDDGKSTLIGRLLLETNNIYNDQLKVKPSKSENETIELAYLLDGLTAEEEQGITIDVANRYFSFKNRRYHVADTPGHIQYTKNTLTGLSNKDIAIILLDVQKGLTEQSKRHTLLASILRIPHLIVVINKMDTVNYKQKYFENIRASFLQYSIKLEIPDLRFIPLSALAGENIVHNSPKLEWYSGEPLLSLLENISTHSHKNLIDFRMPIQYVSKSHTKRYYCGQIASGSIKAGEQILALPTGKEAKIKNIFIGDTTVYQAFTPQSVTIELDMELDICRGDIFIRKGNIPLSTNRFENILFWLDQKPSQKKYLLKHCHKIQTAYIDKVSYILDVNNLHRIKESSLTLNQIARTTITVNSPIYCDTYSKNISTGSFILIDPDTFNTVAAGTIIERKNYNKQSSMQVEKKNARNNSTIWLTGLPASGKSSIANKLKPLLEGTKNIVSLLDGDIIRKTLNSDLGFTLNDRKENIRRTAELARILNQAGITVIAALVSPLNEHRLLAKNIIGKETFIEIFVNTPLDVCEERDPKGMYKLARQGKISLFTGIDSVYESPNDPDLCISTQNLTPEDSALEIFHYLQKKNKF